MPKETAKHRKKTARHERASQHKKPTRSKKPAQAKKPVTQEEQVVGVTAAERQSLQSYTGGQFTAILVDLPLVEDED